MQRMLRSCLLQVVGALVAEVPAQFRVNNGAWRALSRRPYKVAASDPLTASLRQAASTVHLPTCCIYRYTPDMQSRTIIDNNTAEVIIGYLYFVFLVLLSGNVLGMLHHREL